MICRDLGPWKGRDDGIKHYAAEESPVVKIIKIPTVWQVKYIFRHIEGHCHHPHIIILSLYTTEDSDNSHCNVWKYVTSAAPQVILLS